MGNCALSVFTCYAVRSLLCTTTNAMPHERFLNFHRRSMLGRSLPNWLLQPGPVLLRRFVRTTNQPLVDVVELIEANSNFAIIKFPDGRESTVFVTDLAPSPPTHETETSEINLYAVAQPQLISDAPLNKSQSSELREERFP